MTLSKRYLILGGLFGLSGMILGMAMGATENFTLAPVHAHINLLGFVALSLYGIVYGIDPEMGRTKLARIQFWCAAVGVLLLAIPLGFLLLGNKGAIPVLMIGELLTVTTLVLFLVNLWKFRAN